MPNPNIIDVLTEHWLHGDAHERKTVRDTLSIFPPQTRQFLVDLISTELDLQNKPAARAAFLQHVADA